MRYPEGKTVHLADKVRQYELQLIEKDIQIADLQAKVFTSEETLGRMFNMSITGCAYWELGGKITYANPTFLQMVGYSPEDLASGQLNWQTLTPPEFAHTVRQVIAQCKTAGSHPPFTIEYIRKDGSRITVRVQLALLKSQPDLGILYALDVTETQKQETLLREAQARLHALFASPLVGILQWDLTGKVTQANDTLLAMLGYSQEDLANEQLNWAEMTPEEYRSLDQMAARELMASNIHQAYEKEYFRKDGSRIPIMVGGAFFEKSVNQGISVILDLSERKSVLDQLARGGAYYRAIIENNQDGLLLLDQTGKILYSTSANDRIFGYLPGERIGKSIYETIHPADTATIRTLFSQLLAVSNGTIKTAVRMKNREGQYLMIELLAQNLLDNTAIEAIVVNFRDISDRQMAETELTRTLTELKQRNEEMDQYMYRVSHDLRAPLSSILGLVELTKGEVSSDELHQYITLIENRVLRLDNHIRDILNHSKVLKSQPEITRIDFERIIQESFDQFKYLLNWKQVRLQVNLHATADFYGDELRIRIIFENLLSNAIKFINPASTENFVTLTLNSTQEQAIIIFSDNGLGIAPEHLSKVFDMFFRGTYKSDGSGLGLYIVKQAVEKLNGSVSVQSEFGKGTVFMLMLPNNAGHAQLKAKAQE